ncbi:MAG TPA: hypothetical protein VE954_04420 [Oligoflexus sp.]|uniref:hypothetical protein n=1 Tax=Oligoflexus sp. TaxID=1971216 RepID=UPI002D6B7E5D|nr:hypothetical protein [Oligoflexus sp.]HYX32334.1 hypothetical protein [Oligoflexus sp.]
MSKFQKTALLLVLLATVLGAALLLFRKAPQLESRGIPSIQVAEAQIPHHTGKSFGTDTYSWTDSSLRSRKFGLVKNNSMDPTGNHGGYIRYFEYKVNEETRICTGSSDDNPGFGFLVNHYNDAQNSNHWVTSLALPGAYTRRFEGKHHAIHEFKWTMDIANEPLDVTVHWFIANGQDNPIFAITHDLSRAKPNAVNADSRSPYGDIGWDGDKKSVVSGIGWGDRFKFKSTSPTLSMKSSWDYQEQSQIPFAHMWSESANAEMGLVQTQTWLQHDAGGYWLYNSWGKKSEGPMPENWNWTYQLNQYQFESDPSSKRLAWGTNYGAVGQVEYNAYGDDKKLSGYPYQSYSLYVVMGEFKKRAVEQQGAQVESAQSVAISGTNIEAAAEGIAGVGRSDRTAFKPRGWNHVYGTWDLNQISEGPLAFEFKVNRGTLKNPIFRIKLTKSSQIKSVIQDKKILTPDQDYLLSLEQGSDLVWMTLLGEYSRSTRIVLNVLGA